MAGKKLLVADDSLTIQKVIRLALSNEGYEIQAVSDGNDAIQQISLFRPDAVLIDVSLPGKSAFEVKRAINEHADLEEVRFILMSSAFEKVDEPQAAEVRFHGRLTKPFDPAHLRQVLSETLAQVAAKRLEPTSLLQRPAPAAAAPPAPQAPVQAAPPKPTQTAPLPPQQTARPAPPVQTPVQAAPAAAPKPAPMPAQVSAPLPPAPSEHEDIEIDFSVTPPHPVDEPSFLSTTSSNIPGIAPGGADDWMQHGVQPDEPILSAPPPAEDINQLWDQEPTLSTDVALRLQQPQTTPPPAQTQQQAAQRTPPPPASPASLEPAPHGSDPDADIRHLTESTIRMSGLDDFEWSVNEPSLKPPSQLLDSGDSSFQIESAPEQPSGVPPFKPEFVPEIANVAVASNVVEVESPSLTGIPAPTAQVESAASPSDFYRDPADLTKRLMRPTPFTPPAAAPQQRPPQPPGAPRSPSPSGATHAAEASVVGISSDQIEELLRKELQKLLPELAEKIIKQEINRMLNASEGSSP